MSACTCIQSPRRGINTSDDEAISDHAWDCDGPVRTVSQGIRPDAYRENDLRMLPTDQRTRFQSLARRRRIQTTPATRP